jgi:hypothetical protein
MDENPYKAPQTESSPLPIDRLPVGHGPEVHIAAMVFLVAGTIILVVLALMLRGVAWLLSR